MKFIERTLLLFSVFITIIPLSVFAQTTASDQKITISFNNETLKEALHKMEEISSLSFAFSSIPSLDEKITANYTDEKINNILNDLFKNKNISYKEIAGKITIYSTTTPLKKTEHTIHGYISDSETGERLIYANIYIKSTFEGTISNSYGFYSLSTQENELTLVATYMGYQTQEFKLNTQESNTINIALTPKNDELNEVTIVGNKDNKVENNQMSRNDISVQKIKNVPMMMGEADVMKVIQLLPGVQTGTEGTSGIYVRGGGADQNLFLLDGVPVYNASHLLGFCSVFNPDAIKTTKFYKGGFPAHFGGRLSSVVDIAMKDGNMKEFEGDFSIGLISSKLVLEGPIIKDKTSFMLSARRTYVDAIAIPVMAYLNAKKNSQDYVGASFYDINLKLNHIFSERSRLYLSGYHGMDKGSNGSTSNNLTAVDTILTETYNDDFGLSWGNTISSLRWNYVWGSKLFSNTTLTYSNYIFDIEKSYITNQLETSTKCEDLFHYFSGIKDISAKIDFDYLPNQHHTLKFGGGYTHHIFSPGITRYKIENGLYNTARIDTTMESPTIYTNEYSAFIEDEITISPRFNLNAGVYVAAFNVEGKTFVNPQPRLSLRYKVRDNWSLKASYSRMAQYVHLLSSSGINLPADLWVPVTATFKPPVSDQWAIGSSVNLPHGIEFTVESFYKNMNNIIEYKEGASYVNNGTDWESKVEAGRGWSYGIELLLEKTVGKTTGWIGYTWAKNNRKFATINYGKVFPAKYDRRHDINIVITHKFSDKFDIGGTFVYGTGNAVTLALSKFNIADIPLVDIYTSRYELKDYQGRNNFRMSAYHRMDIGANFHKKKKYGVRTWSVSLYNAYNHLNPFMLAWKNDTSNPQIDKFGNVTYPKKLVEYSYFPVIPSVSYSYKF